MPKILLPVFCSIVLLFVSINTGCSREAVLWYSSPPLIRVSDNNQRIAWVQQVPPSGPALGRANAPHKLVVVVDGVAEGQEFEQIDELFISPDGNGIAHVVKIEDKWQMVYNKELIGPAVDEINNASVAFSSDGRHLGFGVRINDRWFMVVDGQLDRGRSWDFIGTLVFSADGSSHVYSAGRDGLQVVVHDGQEIGVFPMLDNLVLSPDGSRLAFVVQEGFSEYVMLDGVAGPFFDRVQDLVFSSYNGDLAYIGQAAGRYQVMRNSLAVGEPAEMILGPLVFGRKDSRLAFSAYRNPGWTVVTDGVDGLLFMDIVSDSIVLADDGFGSAYLAADPNGWFVVRDGQPEMVWEMVVLGDVPYSPDGSRLVYAGRRQGRWHLVDNAVVGSELDFMEISAGSGPNLSPDGEHVVFMARQNEHWHLVLNERLSPPYGHVYRPEFNADGVSFLAASSDNQTLLRVAIDYPDPFAWFSRPLPAREITLTLVPQVPLVEEECVPCKTEVRDKYLES